MKREEQLAIVRALLEQPTAPFHEEAVRDEIVKQLRCCPHVRTEFDPFGNLIARYRHKTRSAAKWAFAAHMDHPGWVRTKRKGFHFLGSVAERYLKKPKLREYGAFAMWDLPAFETRNGLLYSRACDDLLGCAEIICLFRHLEELDAEVHCVGIFTRAEEVGFVGAIQFARSQILPKQTIVFSLETSAPRGGVEIGRGPIVRVGDRVSVFDSAGTLHLLSLANDEDIPVQRALLDGGTCEGTAYQLYGYRSVAASIALGNYHNCAPDGSIGCEYVSTDDYINMIRLCVATACSKADVGEAARSLRGKLEKKAALLKPFYRTLR